MKANLDLRYVAAILLVTSLLLSVNPMALGAIGTAVVNTVHFFSLALMLVVAIGFTAIFAKKDEFIKKMVEKDDNLRYDENGKIESKAASSLIVISTLCVIVICIAIYSGWWITTGVVAWAMLSIFNAFNILKSIKKKDQENVQ